MAFSRIYSTYEEPDPITIEPITSEAPSVLQQAIEYYKPGGEFAGVRGEQLEAKRGTYTARAESQLVGRGLAGTTVGAAIPGAFEQEVATPWRTETEMFRGARLMEAVLAQAGYSERQTAREQEIAIAKAQMELQERLANKQISLEEYKIAMSRLSSGGGAGTVTPRRIMSDLPEDVAPAATGDGDAGYGQHLLESLEYGQGTYAYEQEQAKADDSNYNVLPRSPEPEKGTFAHTYWQIWNPQSYSGLPKR